MTGHEKRGVGKAMQAFRLTFASPNMCNGWYRGSGMCMFTVCKRNEGTVSHGPGVVRSVVTVIRLGGAHCRELSNSKSSSCAARVIYNGMNVNAREHGLSKYCEEPLEK